MFWRIRRTFRISVFWTASASAFVIASAFAYVTASASGIGDHCGDHRDHRESLGGQEGLWTQVLHFVEEVQVPES
jgi:hypothetical protein